MMVKKTPRRNAFLILDLQMDALQVVEVRRAGRAVQFQIRAVVPLALDRLLKEPETAGRDIRKQLSSMGIRDRLCVACIPLDWAFATSAEFPELPPADAESYIAVQAERRFPFPNTDLTMSHSIYQTAGGTRYVTLASVLNNRLDTLEQFLHSARLRPIGITFSIAAEFDRAASIQQGSFMFHVGNHGIDFAVFGGGGIVTLRHLPYASSGERDEGNADIDIDSILTQIRITVGQLPSAIRDSIRNAFVRTCFDRNHPLVQTSIESLQAMGLAVKVETSLLESTGTKQSREAMAGWTRTAGAIVDFMEGIPFEFDFLRPKISRFKQLTARFSSRRTHWMTAAAATLLVSVGVAFFYQHSRLTYLESQWSAMESDVTEIETIQDNIRKYRDWFGDSVRSLAVARTLTEAFPAEGTIWAKSIEVRENSAVSCTGYIRSNQEWQAMMERLLKSKYVQALQVQQVRGESPMQFALSFQWTEGGGDGS